ncbi:MULTISPECIES: hypothetical protein [Candidatus Fukatsuia]|uniref:hypothetical protein n=1 Tax=Candidatus Fukatsuia TaxID=1927833 RepID=UPI001967FBD7|nr:hypothetical protein [Candidatus Fukatsuia symbiotica]
MKNRNITVLIPNKKCHIQKTQLNNWRWRNGLGSLLIPASGKNQKKRAKKRNLHRVNQHFEHVFDGV